jgi:sensor histidine kinase regulating citrate/malate metabolism
VGFDKSTQAYLVQVSVPVKDGGKVIGAVTIGINVDKFK